ncbi:MAG: hypothetical protein LBH43_18150, partial [Treponema sp.]|nr:hypothetical protein [Treponema sp.]
WYNGGTKWNFSTNTVTSDLTLGAKWNLDQSLIASDFDGQNADSIFEVNSTAEWNTAIGAIQAGGDGKNYLINVNGNIVANPGRIFGTVSDIKVAIWGDKEISFSGTGPLFEIGGSENQVPVEQTVILRDLILCGRADNTEAGSLVSINYFGTLEMKGNTVISGNTVTGTTAVGVGVYVKGGKFIMEGGTISSNTGIYNWVGGGAGVSFSSVGLTILGEYRSFSPVFKKTGGIIYGYTAGDPLSNVMKDSGGNIKEDGGAALGLWGGVRRDKTVLPNHILECDGSTWVKWVDDDGVVTNQ